MYNILVLGRNDRSVVQVWDVGCSYKYEHLLELVVKIMKVNSIDSSINEYCFVEYSNTSSFPDKAARSKNCKENNTQRLW